MTSIEGDDYVSRVYAGILGKIIGVYMGRPFEGWTHQQIMDRFGEVSRYVSEEAGAPLVLTDDDIGGTFTFVRALEDYGYDRYRGVCHVLPNYGLIIMGLLYGNGDFRRSMMIVNTSGHDTDCNAGTLGCILGIRNGLGAIEACPDCVFRRAQGRADLWWKDAWVNGVDEWGVNFPEAFHLSQNQGTGLIIQGAREWGDYEVSATITPFLAARAGLAARVQGMRRYYALVLCRDGSARPVKERDGTHVLASAEFAVQEGEPYACSIRACGPTIAGFINGQKLFEVRDEEKCLATGAVALLIDEGTLTCEQVRVAPLGREHGC